MEPAINATPISTFTRLAGAAIDGLASAVNTVRQDTVSKATATPQRSSTAEPASVKDLGVQAPADTKLEKTLDKANTVLSIVTTHELAGTLLAPLSMAGGFWSLARAQNVKGREAHFKAMAVDGVVDYLSLGNGKRLPALSGYPTMTEAARGQGCLGERAPLNSAFHNDRERDTFSKQYDKALSTIRKLYRTPEGRAQLKELVNRYKAFKRANPETPAHVFFLEKK